MGFFFLLLLAICVLVLWVQLIRWTLWHEHPQLLTYLLVKGKGYFFPGRKSVADETEEWLSREDDR